MNRELLDIIFSITVEPQYNICLNEFNNIKCRGVNCINCILSGGTKYILNLEEIAGGKNE